MGCWQSVCGTEFAYKTATNNNKYSENNGLPATRLWNRICSATNLVKIMGCRQPVCGTEFCCIGRGNIENFFGKMIMLHRT